ncbi:hypothetical protein [Porphyromonas gingivalis]
MKIFSDHVFQNRNTRHQAIFSEAIRHCHC